MKIVNIKEISMPGTALGRTIRLYTNTAIADVAKSLQSCSTLCDPIDGLPPGSSVPGNSQARILEGVAISFFRESSQPKD